MSLHTEDVERIGKPILKEDIIGEPVQEYPRIVKEVFENKPLTTKQKFLKTITFGIMKPKRTIVMKKDLKAPLLLLQKNDGYTDIIEGVKKGMFVIKLKDGRKKGVLLGLNKLSTFNMEPYYKHWIAHEDEMTAYPQDIYHDGEEFLRIVRAIETNRDLLKDESKLITAKMWFWVSIIGIGALVLYFGVQAGLIEKLGEMFG